MTRSLSKIRSAVLPRRGLSREEAAIYLGVGAGMFDELRATGVVSPPRLIKSRKLWDIRDLDMAFDNLPREDEPDRAESWVGEDG
jgi:hypothetical protein